jgi:hypothetical protein
VTALTTLTRAEATATTEHACAERDRIRVNLLELDQSLGHRILDGASQLTGPTAARWETARAGLARLWQTFLIYSGVVDRAAELLAAGPRSSGPDLAELAALLTGPSVRLPRDPAALAERDLTDGGEVELTLTAAVGQMRRDYREVAGVLAAAEAAWTALAGPLEDTGQALTRARADLGALADDPLTGQLAAAEAEHRALREVLATDPLSLWAADTVDTTRRGRLADQVTFLAGRAAEVAALRAGAGDRIAAAAGAVITARQASQDARQAHDRAAAVIAAADLPARPPAGGLLTALAARLATVQKLRDAHRWGQLSAELAAVTQQAADAQQVFRNMEGRAAALSGQRDELRGLLGAYRAKAAALGAAEDPALTSQYRHARDLLGTAPCQLAEADQAVRDYQRAVLALTRREERP